MDEVSALSSAQSNAKSRATSGAGVIIGLGAVALFGAAALLYQWNAGYREKYQSGYAADGNRFQL